MPDALISLVGVGKRFDGADVLRDVSFDVRLGEILALVGPSGCGKSTLLRIIAGLMPASSGDVRSDGRPLRGLNPDTALVFQSFALLPWLKAAENVALPLEARGVSVVERLRKVTRARIPASSRGACASAWASPGPCARTLVCSCSTSPSLRSTA